jgi:hypothetical protein
VIERVSLDHNALLIGEESFISHDGRKFEAGKGQPIFHVEHSATATEDKPLSIWHIVHLTNGKDERINWYFKEDRQEQISARIQ